MSVLSLPPIAVPFPVPYPGASLLLSFHPQQRTVLVIGSNRLAASRAFTAIEAGANVVIASDGSIDKACDEIRWRFQRGELEWFDCGPFHHEEEVLETLKILKDLMLVCVTDTLIESSSFRRPLSSASAIASACRSMRVPVNVADVPHLCDFTFPSTYRFPSSAHPPTPTSLQLALTTNGQGCRLASRLRRECTRILPASVGDAVERVGRLRRMAKAHDSIILEESIAAEVENSERDEDPSYPPTPINVPVQQLNPQTVEEDVAETSRRRMRWVAQVSEYWSFDKLAQMSEDEMREVLSVRGRPDKAPRDEPNGGRRCPSRSRPADSVDGPTSPASASNPPSMTSSAQLTTSSVAHVDRESGAEPRDPAIASHHSLSITPLHTQPSQGRIILVGSGPGHPSLLTIAAHAALTKLATLVLSDKLVPQQVLDLIPKATTVVIAKKFPGNAEGAQSELMEMAVEAANRGETVVRLKQGDPFVFGRGGEELIHFRACGFPPLIIPGISSALAGPLLADIPVTQRGVAESVVICTGVGRGGREVQLPSYERAKTVVLLMGVARLASLVARLTGAGYPKETPVAIIERASCPDQRLLATTLEWIVEAADRSGEGRVPGMIVVGWSVCALEGDKGELGVLDHQGGDEAEGEREDADRVRRWLKGDKWILREGLPQAWNWFW